MEPNGSCLHKKVPAEGFIGDKYGFILLILVGTSRDLEDVDTG